MGACIPYLVLIHLALWFNTLLCTSAAPVITEQIVSGLTEGAEGFALKVSSDSAPYEAPSPRTGLQPYLSVGPGQGILTPTRKRQGIESTPEFQNWVNFYQMDYRAALQYLEQRERFEQLGPHEDLSHLGASPETRSLRVAVSRFGQQHPGHNNYGEYSPRPPPYDQNIWPDPQFTRDYTMHLQDWSASGSDVGIPSSTVHSTGSAVGIDPVLSREILSHRPEGIKPIKTHGRFEDVDWD